MQLTLIEARAQDPCETNDLSHRVPHAVLRGETAFAHAL